MGWNNISDRSYIGLEGEDMRLAHNLRVLIVDDSFFHTYVEEELSDLSNHPDNFLFHECCKSLERVSMRKAKYGNRSNGFRNIPQDALIKFVRNAPLTLKWFRSDLTKENMD